MRVVGGKHRGRTLFAPKGVRTRPTSDRVREALFDILGNGVADATFLDAYAGTGAVGIEAESRGARAVVFIEGNRQALAALRRNLAAAGIEARVVAADASKAFSLLCAEGIAFDFVFLDPPYKDADQSLELAGRYAHSGLLAPAGILVLEHDRRNPLRPRARCFELFDERRYGETVLSFFRRADIKDREGQ